MQKVESWPGSFQWPFNGALVVLNSGYLGFIMVVGGSKRREL